MANFIDSEALEIARSRAILVGVNLPGQSDFPEHEPLDELAALAATAGVEVAGRVTQNIRKPNPRTYCGEGKVEEVALQAREQGASLVIFDNELKPSQQAALGETTGARVMDRTELILHIFATHARTHQAKVAVDLARMQYQLPRLKNLWSHLERQRGGLGKLAGAGELQIETDRRIVRDRIARLKRELAEIEARREVEVARRSELFQVALVGYTNAGKSTLMRALTGADVYVADKLFATLDTRTRVWEFGDHKVLLSDTVGFIRDLPHSLVASFHATLSEALHADLLLHVVDVSHPAVEEMIAAVDGVLDELGAHGKRAILAFNKVDRVAHRGSLAAVEALHPESVLVSARSGLGIERLRDAVARVVEEREKLVEFETSAGNGKLLAFMRANTTLLEQRYEGDRVHVRAMVEPRWLKAIADMRAAAT